MNIPDKLLISDLLNHRVFCDSGVDHGPGVLSWMHPPAHRFLGWISRPSSIRVSRHVWKLNQIRGISNNQIFVKGNPTESDPKVLETIPTLIFSNLLDLNAEPLGQIVDAIFNPISGNIENYLISRTDPRIPGTSRWKLSLDKIINYQPNFVFSNISTLDELPLIQSSFRQKVLKKSRLFRDQIKDFSNRATDQLEGWMEDLPLKNNQLEIGDDKKFSEDDPIDDWNESIDQNLPKKWPLQSEQLKYRSRRTTVRDNESDPWI